VTKKIRLLHVRPNSGGFRPWADSQTVRATAQSELSLLFPSRLACNAISEKWSIVLVPGALIYGLLQNWKLEEVISLRACGGRDEVHA
jgi:hypothetical protein